jgi:hypothetical protein
MPYYKYASLCLIIFINLFLEIESFIPAGRLAHSSVLVGYFIGGVLDSGYGTHDVFYLDVSKPFNIQVPPWNDLTLNVKLSFKGGGPNYKNGWGTVSFSDINNEETIYLFGGITNSPKLPSTIHSLNLNTLTWNLPITKGKLPERRLQINSVIDNTGKVYILGGMAWSIIGSPTIYFDEFIIFNIVELSWSISISPVGKRASYTATLLSNGFIVYIGGYDSEILVDLSEIIIYDTKSSSWSNKVFCTNIKI